MALFEVIIPSTLTTNITSNNQKPTFLFCLYPCVALGWTGDLSSALCKISQDRHSLLWLSYDCYKMLMKEVFLRGVKEHWELYLFPARCSAADTQLCSSNTQSANQILLFEICQALDYFPFKLSFIILMESVHLVPHFCSPLQRTNVIPPHVRRTKHDAYKTSLLHLQTKVHKNSIKSLCAAMKLMICGICVLTPGYLG